jgi:hypothetical protein
MALKDFFDWNHKDDKSAVEHAISGGNAGRKAREWLDDGSGAAKVKADELKKAAEAYRGINDATKKLPNQMDQGKTAAEALLGSILAVGKSDPKVKVSAPGFDALFDKTARYGSMLDGLNRTVRTTFVQSVIRNNDTGEGGGTNPQPPGRSGGVTVIHNGDIKSDSPRDYVRNAQRLSRQRSGGGVNIP